MIVQRGSSLFEVLITLLLVSIGVLGQVRVQLNAKQVIFDAEQRTLAAAIAQDVIETLQANAGALSGYVVEELGDPEAAPTPRGCASDCSPEALRTHHIYRWYQALRGENNRSQADPVAAHGLLSPRLCIDVTTAGLVTVVIAWRGKGGNTGFVSVPASTAALRCGSGSGLYGEEDRQRRLLTVSSYVALL